MTTPMIDPLEPRRLLSAEPGLLVNAGGGAVYDAIARDFAADLGFAGGRAESYAGDVAGTPDDTLHRTHRIGGSFAFSAAVPDGDYLLVLKFAEPSLPAGGRSFDVAAEGVVVLDDYDVAASAGGVRTAVNEVVRVTVADGRLDLTFTGNSGGEAVVSAIVLAPTDVPEAVKPYHLVPPGDAGDTALEVISASHLRGIAQGAFLYANDHDAFLPADLTLLVRDNYFDDPAVLAGPRTGTEPPRAVLSSAERAEWALGLDDYLYVGAGRRLTTLGPDTPIAYENPARTPGRINVAYADGHVAILARADAAALLGFPDAPPTDGPSPREPVVATDPLVDAVHEDLREIARQLRRSADIRTGVFPADLGRIVELYSYIDPAVFVSPRTDTAVPGDWASMSPQGRADWVNANSDYAYNAALRRDGGGDGIDGESVLAFEKLDKIVRGPTNAQSVAMGYGNAERHELPYARQLVDASRPFGVRSIDYDFDAPRPEVRINATTLFRGRWAGDFDGGDGLELTSIQSTTLTNLTTGQPIDLSNVPRRYDDATKSIVLTFAGPLPDGDYRVDVPAFGLTSLGGTFNRSAAAGSFFALAGDANRDRAVNLADFTRLAANFGRDGRLFSQGDFNYDGRVNLADFTILAGSFGRSLGPPPSLFGDGGEDR